MGTESPKMTPELKLGKQKPGWAQRGQCKLGGLIARAGLTGGSPWGASTWALTVLSGEAVRIQRDTVWMCRAWAQLHLGLRTPESGHWRMKEPRMGRERVSHGAGPGFPGGGLDLLEPCHLSRLMLAPSAALVGSGNCTRSLAPSIQQQDPSPAPLHLLMPWPAPALTGLWAQGPLLDVPTLATLGREVI